MNSLPLFDLPTASLRKREGMSRAADNSALFLARIRAVARGIAEFGGHVTSDDLRHHAKHLDLVPHHKNVWGCVFAGGEWEPCGYVKSKLVSNHGRVIRMWRLKEDS